jgi:hypothetical protein
LKVLIPPISEEISTPVPKMPVLADAENIEAENNTPASSADGNFFGEILCKHMVRGQMRNWVLESTC